MHKYQTHLCRMCVWAPPLMVLHYSISNMVTWLKYAMKCLISTQDCHMFVSFHQKSSKCLSEAHFCQTPPICLNSFSFKIFQMSVWIFSFKNPPNVWIFSSTIFQIVCLQCCSSSSLFAELKSMFCNWECCSLVKVVLPEPLIIPIPASHNFKNWLSNFALIMW